MGKSALDKNVEQISKKYPDDEELKNLIDDYEAGRKWLKYGIPLWFGIHLIADAVMYTLGTDLSIYRDFGLFVDAVESYGISGVLWGRICIEMFKLGSTTPIVYIMYRQARKKLENYVSKLI